MPSQTVQYGDRVGAELRAVFGDERGAGPTTTLDGAASRSWTSSADVAGKLRVVGLFVVSSGRIRNQGL